MSVPAQSEIINFLVVKFPLEEVPVILRLLEVEVLVGQFSDLGMSSSQEDLDGRVTAHRKTALGVGANLKQEQVSLSNFIKIFGSTSVGFES